MHPGPVLVVDAVRAYVEAVRDTPSARFRQDTLDDVAAVVGGYWPLVEIDDAEFTGAVESLWRSESIRLRRRRVAVVDEWVTWCRAAALPAPALCDDDEEPVGTLSLVPGPR